MTAADALDRPQVRREIGAKAKADDRTVKRVLRGGGKRNSAWEGVTEAMASLGVDQAPPRLVAVPHSTPDGTEATG